MVPANFKKKYPEVSLALVDMLGGLPGARIDATKQTTIQRELRALLEINEPTADLARAIWNEVGGSSKRFFEHGIAGYHYLGVSDDVRTFVGQLWSSALQSLPIPTRQEFLNLVVGQERFFLFEALDFSPRIFRDVLVAPAFMAGWVVAARKAVGNDLYQRGLLGCLENYARYQPLAALELIKATATQRHDPQIRSTLARMLCWVRDTPEAMSNPVKSALESVEASLRAPGDSALRGLLLESWALAAGSPMLDESKALALRDELLGHGDEPELSWCFLLARIVDAATAHWAWTRRELVRMSTRPLATQSKYWVIVAALHGWANAADSESEVRDDWADLFFALQPLTKTDGGAWQQFEHVLVGVFEKNPDRATAFLVRFAAISGRAWCELLDEEREHLAWLNRTLQEKGHAARVVTALCLSEKRRARSVGVKLFTECNVEALLPEAVATADATTLELLVMQASLRLGEYDHTARLHASVARRVDELGGELAEAFYDEVAIQALNTNQYRVALEKNANGHAKLLASLQEAHRRIDATIQALKSPALKLRIPGRKRAENLAMRRFSRSIAKGFSKFSILERFATTVPLLYGKTWRMQDAGGNLSGASTMQKSEVSMEMPRLEYVTPDAMRHRRLFAGRRIDELERRAEGSDE